MPERKAPTKPINLPIVDVVGLQTPVVKALLSTAAAMRLLITADDGTTNEVEFIIAGRTAQDCNRALQGFKQWQGGDLNGGALREVVIMQQSCVVLDDEL